MRRGRDGRHHRTLVLLPVVGAEPLIGRLRPLQTLLLSRSDEATGAFDLQVGDELSVVVVAAELDRPRRRLAVEQLNLVTWPAPASRGQYFTACFREGADTPDAAIFASGRAGFEPWVLDPPVQERLYAGGSIPEGAELTTGFEMVFPTRVPLVRPGRFTFFVSLTLRVGEGTEAMLQTFGTDPEMNVQGSYPPDDPPPAASNGTTER